MAEPSLKIKIPSKRHTEQSDKTTAVSRKAVKRRITSDEDNSDVPSESLQTAVGRHAKKQRSSPDVETRIGDPSRTSQRASGSAATGVKISFKKKIRLISDDDGDFVPEPEEVESKLKTKDAKSKIKGGGTQKFIARNETSTATTPVHDQRGKKRPREAEAEDSMVDVTTISASVSTVRAAAASTPGQRDKKWTKEDEDISVEVTTIPASDSALPSSVALPEDLPLRKKLPPIKKKPRPDAASMAASPASVLSGAAKSAVKPGPGTPSSAALSKKPLPPVHATTTNPSGSGDFDLRDMNTWASLIGRGSSSSGPRVGIEKRVSMEERKKQLEKMRDEARSAREQQFREPFDLQAQSRKIAAFEKKLQTEHNVKMNGPHILGAAFFVRPIPQTRPR